MASVSASPERPTGAALGQLIRLLSVADRQERRGLPRTCGVSTSNPLRAPWDTRPRVDHHDDQHVDHNEHTMKPGEQPGAVMGETLCGFRAGTPGDSGTLGVTRHGGNPHCYALAWY
jgi:hypothetical protein